MKYKANSTIPISNIKITDEFFNKYRDLVGNVIIPYQWDVLNDRLEDVETSHCIENFKIAAGLSNGKFKGAVFQDTDLAKWIEAVGFYLSSYGRDEELEKIVDETIELIAKAQQPDGYLDTYFIITAPDKKWQNLCEGHELYTAGHFMEAAVAYYEATGKDKLINVVRKLADLLCEVFGPEEGKCHGYPGHPEVEVGLVKLYRITGEKKYLNLAKHFIDIRGVGDNYFLQEEKQKDFKRIFPEFADYDPSYSQSHMPVRKQTTAEGHAVRAAYLYSAMADVAAEYDDEELLESCKTLWDDMVHRRMYITGSIGSSGWLERFTTDYDLPNDCNYSESCASIALAMFGKRMGEITGDATYFDEVERALYNTVLSGIAMDGKGFFYVNPLEMWPDSCKDHTSKLHVKSQRQKWFGVACCPPNIARTLASLGQYIYTANADSIAVNMYVSNETRYKTETSDVLINLDSNVPWEGHVTLKVDMEELNPYEILLRVPYYAKNFKVILNDKEINESVDKGYFHVKLTKKKSLINVTFDMPSVFMRANPKVRADSGKVAVMKGPLVYCLEEIDNGDNLASIYVKTDAEITEIYDNKMLGGTMKLSFEGARLEENGWDSHTLYSPQSTKLQKVKITAVPYCYWGNRKVSQEMLVWMKELLY
ncbi:MAG: glycoside hydrolase family 127 protein [Pseudobutyrivibrio sp.]|nr:glycoside hydrolase family 127 protein [Pseudobutyrivibrio sp.]